MFKTPSNCTTNLPSSLSHERRIKLWISIKLAGVAAVDQWYRQRLPSFGKGFEFQVKRNTLVQIIYFSFELECKKNEKEAGVAHF